MDLFDVNCLVGPWPSGQLAYRDVPGLLKEMSRLGIAQAVVSHTLARQHHPAIGNRLLMEQIGNLPGLEPCWVLLPLGTNEMGDCAALFREMAAQRVRAVRLYPRDHGYPLTDWCCGDLLSELDVRRYIVLIDLDQLLLPVGLYGVIQAGWQCVDWICRNFPHLSLVLTNIGYRALRALIPLLNSHRNLFIDLAFFSSHAGVEFVTEQCGVERLLFGTGQPLVDPAGAVARLCYADISRSQRQAIGRYNTERLLKRVQFHGKGGERKRT